MQTNSRFWILRWVNNIPMKTNNHVVCWTYVYICHVWLYTHSRICCTCQVGHTVCSVRRSLLLKDKGGMVSRNAIHIYSSSSKRCIYFLISFPVTVWKRSFRIAFLSHYRLCQSATRTIIALIHLIQSLGISLVIEIILIIFISHKCRNRYVSNCCCVGTFISLLELDWRIVL